MQSIVRNIIKEKRLEEEPKAQNEPSVTTAEKLATQHNVSRETIKRDEEYAKAVDTTQHL